jgi:hypothetical protein
MGSEKAPLTKRIAALLEMVFLCAFILVVNGLARIGMALIRLHDKYPSSALAFQAAQKWARLVAWLITLPRVPVARSGESEPAPGMSQ